MITSCIFARGRSTLDMESSIRWRLIKAPTSSVLNQATFIPFSTARCPSASEKWLLPVPDGPQMTRFSFLVIHSSVISPEVVAWDMEDFAWSQTEKVFPAGKCARDLRISDADLSLPALSVSSRTFTTSAGSHLCALAVRLISGKDSLTYLSLSERHSFSISCSDDSHLVGSRLSRVFPA